MSDEIPPDAVNVTVTCRTEECGNKDIPIFIAELYGSAMCGVCRATITDIKEGQPND